MSDRITPDEAIDSCLLLGAQGISLGLAKQLQAERDALRAELAAAREVVEAAAEYARLNEGRPRWETPEPDLGKKIRAQWKVLVAALTRHRSRQAGQEAK